MTLSDHELMARVRERDAGAFEALCERNGEPLRRHMLRMLRDADAAEDVLQETLLRAWTHAAQWDGRGTPRAWLFRIATNLALNHIRALRRRPPAAARGSARPDRPRRAGADHPQLDDRPGFAWPGRGAGGDRAPGAAAPPGGQAARGEARGAAADPRRRSGDRRGGPGAGHPARHGEIAPALRHPAPGPRVARGGG